MVKNPKMNTVLSHRHELYITGYKIFHGLDLYEAEREFIGRALCMIGKGHDPGEGLQSKAKRGENVGDQAVSIENRNRIADDHDGRHEQSACQGDHGVRTPFSSGQGGSRAGRKNHGGEAVAAISRHRGPG